MRIDVEPLLHFFTVVVVGGGGGGGQFRDYRNFVVELQTVNVVIVHVVCKLDFCPD